MKDELRRILKELQEKIGLFGRLLSVKEKEEQIHKLQLKMSEAGFWDNAQEAKKVITQLKNAKETVESWRRVAEKISEEKELLEICEDKDLPEVEKDISFLEKELNNLEFKVLLSDRFDSSNAIVEINSGAGGTEACDWASMLFRMYSRWAEEKKFRITVLNELKGEEAGIKNVTFVVEGEFAYGFLKAEKGVHRLVRISPFDANKRRHTSFASVDVIPEISQDIEIEIKPEELKIDTFRSSGAGGQHVNVTDSAVRITHVPTGIIVTCQNERSQYQNKQRALAVLKAKLYEQEKNKQKENIEKISGEKKKIEWGSQIRSYILHPYLLVKDHRTGCEDSNASAVLSGKIDKFIYEYLKYLKSQND